MCFEEEAHNLFVRAKRKSPFPPGYPRTLFQSGCKFTANRQDIETKSRFMRLAYLVCYKPCDNNPFDLDEITKLNYSNT